MTLTTTTYTTSLTAGQINVTWIPTYPPPTDDGTAGVREPLRPTPAPPGIHYSRTI